MIKAQCPVNSKSTLMQSEFFNLKLNRVLLDLVENQDSEAMQDPLDPPDSPVLQAPLVSGVNPDLKARKAQPDPRVSAERTDSLVPPETEENPAQLDPTVCTQLLRPTLKKFHE